MRTSALFALILAIPGVFILNGPGFRAIAEWGIGKGLAMADLSGEFELSGTLLSGIEIRDLEIGPVEQAGSEADAPSSKPAIVRGLAVGVAEVRYGFAPLLKGDPLAAIELVRLHDITATIALPASDEKTPEAAPPEPDTSAEKANPLETVWKLLGISYDLQNINVRLLQEDREILALDGLTLQLPAKGEGELGFTRLRLGETIERGDTRASLRSTGDSLVVGRFEPIEGIALSELTLLKDGDDLVSTEVEAAGGSVFARYAKDGSIAVELREGAIDIARLAEQFGAGEALTSGKLDALKLGFSGDFVQPATWNTNAELKVSSVTFPGEGIDSATLRIGATGGKIDATLDLARKEATVHVDATTTVDENADLKSLAKLAPDVELSAELPRIENFLPENSFPLSGSATLALRFSGPFTEPARWDADARITASDVTFPGEAIDTATLLAGAKDGKITAKLDVERKEAIVHATANATIAKAASLKDLADLAADIELSADIPGIEMFLPEGAPPVRGSVSLQANAKIEARQLRAGQASFSTSGLSYGDVPIDSLAIQLNAAENNAVDLEIDLALDEANRLAGSGRLGLDEITYDAELTGHLVADDRVSQLLSAFNFDKALKGKVDLSWTGEGAFKPADEQLPHHRGAAKVTASEVRIADGRHIESANVAANYSPGVIEIETLDVLSGDLAISTSASYRDDALEVTSLSIRQNDLDLVSGSLRAPVDPAAFKEKGALGFFEQDGSVEVELESAELRIEDLAALAGIESPVTGAIHASIDVHGTPQQLDGGGSIRADGLQLPKTPDLPPADLALQFALEPERFTASGTLEHPQIETLRLEASAPFTPSRWISGESALIDEPLQARLTLPTSSLEFLKDYAPSIELLEASAAADVEISGTIGQPVASGTLDIAVDQLKLANPSAPRVRDTAIKLRAEGRELFIDTFDALVSGGQLSLGGKISLPIDAESPVFDVSATAREALVARNEDLSVRANANLTLTGPWTGATLAGEIGITNSRYIKDIDILPLSLPQRDRSDLPPIEDRPTAALPPDLDLGVEIEPFSNWQFDVKLVTADPFLVRSNLAQIDVVSDLRITGTGASPVPSGSVSIAEGRLSLPFSRVEIEEADIRFSEASGFNGKLNVKATAEVRSNQINMFVHGNLLNPKNVLTSDPPQPNEDIISLLATGVTREELAGGTGAVAASRVAQLFLTKLRQDNVDPNDENRLLREVEDRTTVDFGQTDPRTGQQTLSGRIRLFRQYYLVANVGADSDYRILLKYLFKFR